MKKLDFYSVPLLFHYQGTDSYPTHIGVILSILTVLLSIALAVFFSVDMIQKLNPSFTNQLMFENDNTTINLSDSKFINFVFQPYKMTGLTGQNFNYSFDRTMFNFFFESYTYTTHPNGTKDTSLTLQKLKRCEVNEFEASNHDFFYKNNFNTTAYCMSSKDLSVKGQFSSPDFKFLKFTMKECVNNVTDSIGLVKEKCKSRAEISSDISNWRVSLFITFPSPKPSNYEQNYNMQIYNQGLTLSYATYPKTNYFFRMDKMKTDTNLFVPSDDSHEITYVPTFDHLESEIVANDLSKTGLNFFMLYMRINSAFYDIRISYKKLPMIIAETVSFITPIHFVFMSIAKIFSSFNLKLDLINSLFHKKDNKVVKLIQEKLKYNKIEIIDDKNPNPLRKLKQVRTILL